MIIEEDHESSNAEMDDTPDLEVEEWPTGVDATPPDPKKKRYEIPPLVYKEVYTFFRSPKLLVITSVLNMLLILTMTLNWPARIDLRTDPLIAASQGRELFASLTFFMLILVVFSSPLLAGGSISGENEKRTLSLLMVSPITPKQLVLQKYLASFIPTLYTVLATIPIMMFINFFGGVPLRNIVISYIFILTTGLMITAVSFYFSSSSQSANGTTGKALGVTIPMTLFLVWPFYSVITNPLAGIVFISILFLGYQVLVFMFIGFSISGSIGRVKNWEQTNLRGSTRSDERKVRYVPEKGIFMWVYKDHTGAEIFENPDSGQLFIRSIPDGRLIPESFRRMSVTSGQSDPFQGRPRPPPPPPDWKRPPRTTPQGVPTPPPARPEIIFPGTVTPLGIGIPKDLPSSLDGSSIGEQDQRSPTGTGLPVPGGQEVECGVATNTCPGTLAQPLNQARGSSEAAGPAPGGMKPFAIGPPPTIFPPLRPIIWKTLSRLSAPIIGPIRSWWDGFSSRDEAEFKGRLGNIQRRAMSSVDLLVGIWARITGRVEVFIGHMKVEEGEVPPDGIEPRIARFIGRISDRGRNGWGEYYSRFNTGQMSPVMYRHLNGARSNLAMILIGSFFFLMFFIYSTVVVYSFDAETSSRMLTNTREAVMVTTCGLFGIVVFFMSGYLAAARVAQEAEKGTLPLLLASPMDPSKIISGVFGLSLIQTLTATLFLLPVFIFYIPYDVFTFGDIVVLYLVLTALAIHGAGVGTLVSAYSSKSRSALLTLGGIHMFFFVGIQTLEMILFSNDSTMELNPLVHIFNYIPDGAVSSAGFSPALVFYLIVGLISFLLAVFSYPKSLGDKAMRGVGF